MLVVNHTKAPVASYTTMISSLDDVVTVAAESRLLKSPYLELRRVSCEFRTGILTLRGRVSTYYLKQIAQTVVRQVGGVEEIDNQLDVALLPSETQIGIGSH